MCWIQRTSMSCMCIEWKRRQKPKPIDPFIPMKFIRFIIAVVVEFFVPFFSTKFSRDFNWLHKNGWPLAVLFGMKHPIGRQKQKKNEKNSLSWNFHEIEPFFQFSAFLLIWWIMWAKEKPIIQLLIPTKQNNYFWIKNTIFILLPN